jgi:predicted RNA binding protein YcfA (HicA-like mRNA interferase family)
MKARELIRLLEQAGWVAVRSRGSHRTFKHADTPELITVPLHSGDLKKGLERAILKQAGLDPKSP